MELADRGVNVIGVARTQSALDSLKSEFGSKGLLFYPVCLDINSPGAANRIFEEIRIYLDDLKIVCFNATLSAFGSFEKIPLKVQSDIISMNVNFPVYLTHLFLPFLKKQDFASVIYISSNACLQPMPWVAVYAAAKHFIHAFSLALAFELKDTTVQVITAVPSHMDTFAMKNTGIPNSILSNFGQGAPPPPRSG